MPTERIERALIHLRHVEENYDPDTPARGTDMRRLARAARTLADTVAEMEALLIEGVPQLAKASGEFEDFMGMRCNCCYAILDSYDTKRWPLSPHLPDCWAAKVSRVTGWSARRIAKVVATPPTFPWDVPIVTGEEYP